MYSSRKFELTPDPSFTILFRFQNWPEWMDKKQELCDRLIELLENGKQIPVSLYDSISCDDGKVVVYTYCRRVGRLPAAGDAAGAPDAGAAGQPARRWPAAAAAAGAAGRVSRHFTLFHLLKPKLKTAARQGRSLYLPSCWLKICAEIDRRIQFQLYHPPN